MTIDNGTSNRNSGLNLRELSIQDVYGRMKNPPDSVFHRCLTRLQSKHRPNILTIEKLARQIGSVRESISRDKLDDTTSAALSYVIGHEDELQPSSASKGSQELDLSYRLARMIAYLARDNRIRSNSLPQLRREFGSEQASKVEGSSQQICIPQEYFESVAEATHRLVCARALERQIFGGPISQIDVSSRYSEKHRISIQVLFSHGYRKSAISNLSKLISEFVKVNGPDFLVEIDSSRLKKLMPKMDQWREIELVCEMHRVKIVTPEKIEKSKLDLPITTIQNLAVLDKSIERVHSRHGTKIFDNTIIVGVWHMLKDVGAFANAFLLSGACPDDIFVTGIPYSTKMEESIRLKRIGVLNVLTPTSLNELMRDVEDQLIAALYRAKETRKKILVIEDGGYIVPLLYNKEENSRFHAAMLSLGFKDLKDIFIGVVEQTANGIWRDRDLIGEDRFEIPVMDVPGLRLKQQLEPPHIGEAVANNLNRLMMETGEALFHKQCMVFAYGAIGKSIARALRGRQSNHGENPVFVWDPNFDARERALQEGYITADDPAELIKKAQIIVGASGTTSINREYLDALIQEHKPLVKTLYIASGSSKQVEIDVAYMSEKANKITPLRADSQHIGTRFEYDNGKVIVLIADGFPVNFYAGGQSVPAEHIAPVLAALFESAVELKYPSDGLKRHPPKFVTLSEKAETAIARDYEAFCYGNLNSIANANALWPPLLRDAPKDQTCPDNVFQRLEDGVFDNTEATREIIIPADIQGEQPNLLGLSKICIVPGAKRMLFNPGNISEEAAYFVLQGSGKLRSEHGRMIVRKGDWIILPSRSGHEAYISSSEAMVLLRFFAKSPEERLTKKPITISSWISGRQFRDPRYGVVYESAPASNEPESLTQLGLAVCEVMDGKCSPLAFHETLEEVYVILEGKGVMQVGTEKREVQAGDCINIPRGLVHRIQSCETGRSNVPPLRFLVVTTPPYDINDDNEVDEFTFRSLGSPIELAPGEELSTKADDKERAYSIVSGSGSLQISGRPLQEYWPQKEEIFVPSQTPHTWKSKGRETLRMVRVSRTAGLSIS